MLRKRDFMTEEEIRYERNERRKELESERDYYNAYYYDMLIYPLANKQDTYIICSTEIRY